MVMEVIHVCPSGTSQGDLACETQDGCLKKVPYVPWEPKLCFLCMILFPRLWYLSVFPLALGRAVLLSKSGY